MPNDTYPTIIQTSGPMHGPRTNEKGYVDHTLVFVAIHLPGHVVQQMIGMFQEISEASIEHTEQSYNIITNPHLKSEEVWVREAIHASNQSMKIGLECCQAALLKMAEYFPTPAVDELAANAKDASVGMMMKEEDNE